MYVVQQEHKTLLWRTILVGDAQGQTILERGYSINGRVAVFHSRDNADNLAAFLNKQREEHDTALPENVNHPPHYGGADNPYEHVKVAEALGWHRDAMIYNCTKYLWRLGRKDGAAILEDLRKAMWYLDRRIKSLEATPARHRLCDKTWQRAEPRSNLYICCLRMGHVGPCEFHDEVTGQSLTPKRTCEASTDDGRPCELALGHSGECEPHEEGA